MTAVWILTIIFTFIIIITTIDNKHSLKKKKIDAALKMREMEMGLPPGTYSSYNFRNRKDRHKARNGEQPNPGFAEWKQNTNRVELKKGIDDLQQRLANLETIMNSRKAEPDGTHDKE